MMSLPLLTNEKPKKLSNNKSNLEDYVIKCYNIPANINETIFEYLCELLNDKSYEIKKIIKPINQETCNYPWKIICNDKLASFLLKKKKIFIYDDSEKSRKIYVKIATDEEDKETNNASDNDLNNSCYEQTENENTEKNKNIEEDIPHSEKNENVEIKKNKKVTIFDGGDEENITGPMKRCENSNIWYCKYNSKCEESDSSECFSDCSSGSKSDYTMDGKNKNKNFSDNNSENSDYSNNSDQESENNEKNFNKSRGRTKYSQGSSSENESSKNSAYNQSNVPSKEYIKKYIEECMKGEKKKKKKYKWENISKEIIKDITNGKLTGEEYEFLEKMDMKYSKKFSRMSDNDNGSDKKRKKFFIYFYEGNNDEIIQDIREEDINKNIIL
ncbi:conserved Plasmodium protein, unknown function [Plasmodium chabaudi chabaudi]|uniref:Uncharacterized protein n=1 Tax=Plasmodium chabaudi chabaudi TaxID=31271 RepID=A0A4V0K7P1_PLACU|nr:conserved Plasmodium protein, unknown function [Plasmodium chabaudi chabaudi]VTZ68956.1 conserved Plasmodium protein, unknown function [Plasmodium chabaudi chabaudi]|eukprot:XP_744268.2 conserved Plasmodium protein, unknown function [Plasmodium chabaudi chabaudi]